MAKYSQAGRSLRVSTPLGRDVLLLESVHGHSGLSQLFHFRLELLAENGTDIPFDQLLGQPIQAEFEPAGAPPLRLCGIVQAVAEDEPGDIFTPYQVDLVPHLWLLTRTVRSRIFQDQTVPEILKTVLSGLDVVYSLQGHYFAHNYCVQYDESDMAFASRIMEEEGIYYYFQTHGDHDQLVLADTSVNAPTVAEPASILFDRIRGGVRTAGRVYRWRKRQEVRSNKYTLWDHSFQLPGQTLHAVDHPPATVNIGRVHHALGDGDREIFAWPAGFAHRFDGIGPDGSEQAPRLQDVFADNRRTARLRMEAETAAGFEIRGEGTCRHFAPGLQFALTGHGAADGDYLLTRVEHFARTDAYRTGGTPTDEYHNVFTCLPIALPYRPAQQTPKPVIGLQTATVVGLAGEEITTDKFGRIKVQFHWDREGKKDNRSSCWVRFAHGWAGKGWGLVSIPRVGQEVVIDFVAGDPDQPLAVGGVYNAEQGPPFPLPEGQTLQGLKAQTAGVNGDPVQFSGLGIETRTGAEHVHVRSQLDRTDRSARAHFVHAGRVHHTQAGRYSSRLTGGFTGLSSGSGTGAGSGAGGDGPPPSPLDTWGGWMGATLGQERSGIIGSGNDFVLGTELYSVINPLGLIQLVPAGAMTAGLSAAFAGATATMGYSQAMIGGASDITYGSSVTVHRGPKWYVDTPVLSGARANVCKLLLLLYTAAEIGQCMAQEHLDDKSFSQGAWETSAISMSSKVLYDILMAIEVLGLAVDQENMAKNLMPSGSAGLNEGGEEIKVTTEKWAFWLRYLVWALNIALELVVGAATAPSKGSGGGSGVTTDAPAMSMHTHESDYYLTAPTVTLTSYGVDGVLANVTLQAVGDGTAPFVTASANGEVGYVTLDCGTEGILTLQSGSEKLPNALEMAPEGITVTSAELIALLTDENTVEIDPEVGVTITAGENTVLVADELIEITAGASSITLTDDSITLEAGGATLELSSAGIVINGVTVTMTGDSAISLSAPLMNISD